MGVVQGVFGSEGIDLGQRGRRLTYVELAGDDIGDQAGAVFRNQPDLTTGLGDGGVDVGSSSIKVIL